MRHFDRREMRLAFAEGEEPSVVGLETVRPFRVFDMKPGPEKALKRSLNRGVSSPKS